MPENASGISPVALAATGLGALIIWAGLKGTSAIGGLRSLVSGQQPSGSNIYPLGSSSIDQWAAGGYTGPATDSAIAQQGLSYVGSGSTYLWGGGNPQGWDCSGFVNYVMGHDLGLSIPGYRTGSFQGTSHGPVTSQWAIWNGCTSVSRSQVQAGDLIIWPAFHMGIAINNTQFVNCPGPNGTPAPIVTTIDSTNLPGIMLCRRPVLGAITPPVGGTPLGRASTNKPL
jgi:hypothetical protein